MTDLCSVSDYSRHQMRGLLDELPMYANHGTQARVAAEYTAHDLLVIALCCRLESHYSLRRTAVVAVAQDLYRQLGGPRSVAPDAKLLLRFDPPSAVYLQHASHVDDGLVVALEPLFRRVDEYLLPAPLTWRGPQGTLPLSPVGIGVKARLPANKGMRQSGQAKSKQK